MCLYKIYCISLDNKTLKHKIIYYCRAYLLILYIFIYIIRYINDIKCVCVCVHVYVVYEDTNLYNDMGMT